MLFALSGCQNPASFGADSTRQGAEEPPLQALQAPSQSYVLNEQGRLFPREILSEARVYAKHGNWLQVAFAPAQFIHTEALPQASVPILKPLHTGSAQYCPVHDLQGFRLGASAQHASGELDVFGLYNGFVQVGHDTPLGWMACPCVTLHDDTSEESMATPTPGQGSGISAGRPQFVKDAFFGWDSLDEFQREGRLIQITTHPELEGNAFYPDNDPWHYEGCGDLSFHTWISPDRNVNESASIHNAQVLGLEEFIAFLSGDLKFTSVDGGDASEVELYVSNIRSRNAASVGYSPVGEGAFCRMLYRMSMCVQLKAPNVTHMTLKGNIANVSLRAKVTDNYGKPKVTCNNQEWTVPLNPFVCEDGLSGRGGSPYRLYWSPRGWN